MQTVLSRIWNRVAVSISYDDNHYTPEHSTQLDSTDRVVGVDEYILTLITNEDSRLHFVRELSSNS